MKYLLLLIYLSCSVVHAASWEKDNNAGGQIVLTDRLGKDCKENMKVVYATNKEGEVLFGCWTVIDNRVWIALEGNVRVHSMDSFRIIRDQSESTKPAKGM